MSTQYPQKIVCLIALFLLQNLLVMAQEVPIQNYSTNLNGQVLLEVNSTQNHYYILKIRRNLNAPFDIPTSMTLGQAGTTIITEPLGAYPLAHYQVLEYPINTPADTDKDGIDDITEYNNIPTQSPINAAPIISIGDGTVIMDSFAEYKRLSIRQEHVAFSEYLSGLGFFKFIITDFDTDKPIVYFINTNAHDLHQSFSNTVGIDHLAPRVQKGQIVYNPTSISANGSIGTFAFNYTGGHGTDFKDVQRTHELLAANMPFLENNLSFFVTGNSEDEYDRDIDSFNNSRLPVLLEKDVYADVDFWGLNQTEGYGFFHKVGLDEIPSAKDIVLYDALPNALPRVGGIITSVIQTPLSHVNLRAIQNKIPNAFIRDPLSIDSIADLLGKYIYFKVEQDKYIIREATVAEVNNWFDDIRPKEEQEPPLNLCQTEILPLDKIGFKSFDAFGAKCANIATMRTFDFPEGTIPNGYGIPFYYYQEYMKHNGFFSEIRTIINKPSFIADRDVRDSLLDAFRKKVRKGTMPNWMLDELSTLQSSFPVGTSIRCRSSTNNEDLPGFNGAGLYTSKTQHPDEGHIQKSVKQVYASLWNLRAFEEREFYRVNHFMASMGILCHPNYQDEKSNGVGVTTDPIYNTDNTFYLNSQIGEELITNPDSNAIPEEILIDRVSNGSNDYIVIHRSNLTDNEAPVLNEAQLDEMRKFMSVIHDEFKTLYRARDGDNFAMDIEYKITKDGQLIVKQARPWVSYIFNDDYTKDPNNNLLLRIYPNPANACINVQCDNCNLAKINIYNISGRLIKTEVNQDHNKDKFHFELNDLPSGIYIISSFLENGSLYKSERFIKR